MQNIFEESKMTGQGVVDHRGYPIKVYNYEAKGLYPVHGIAVGPESDFIGQWALDGTGPYKHDILTLYHPAKHFPWKSLPSWANMYIFRRAGDWYCSSNHPIWDENEELVKSSTRGVTVLLPDSIVETILLTVDDRNSLFINPEYDEESV